MEINGFQSAKDYLDEVNRIFQKTQALEMKIAMKYCNMALVKQIPEARTQKILNMVHGIVRLVGLLIAIQQISIVIVQTADKRLSGNK